MQIRGSDAITENFYIRTHAFCTGCARISFLWTRGTLTASRIAGMCSARQLEEQVETLHSTFLSTLHKKVMSENDLKMSGPSFPFLFRHTTFQTAQQGSSVIFHCRPFHLSSALIRIISLPLRKGKHSRITEKSCWYEMNERYNREKLKEHKTLDVIESLLSLIS